MIIACELQSREIGGQASGQRAARDEAAKGPEASLALGLRLAGSFFFSVVWRSSGTYGTCCTCTAEDWLKKMILAAVLDIVKD